MPVRRRAALAAAFAVYAGAAWMHGVRSPGYHYDEALLTHGAVHMLRSGGEPPFAHDPGSWVTIAGRQWPLMVLPYAGAIKHYLMLVPFTCFGVHYEVARLVSLLLGAAGIWAVAGLLGDCCGPGQAAAGALILAVSPSYLKLNFYDHGTVTQWMLSFWLLTGAVRRYCRAASTGRAFWAGAAAGFGVWARANFVWMLASMLAAGWLVYGSKMRRPVRHWAAAAAGGLIAGAPLLYYQVVSHGGIFRFMAQAKRPEPWSELLAHRARLLGRVLLSDMNHRPDWQGPELAWWAVVLISALALAAGVVCFRMGRTARWLALTTLGMLFFLFSSTLHVNEHHVIYVVPLAAAMAGVAGCELWGRSWPVKLAVAAAAVFYVAAAVWMSAGYARGIRESGGRGLWSGAPGEVWALMEREYPGRTVTILDWGLANNLYVLSAGRIKMTELFVGSGVEKTGTGRRWEEEARRGGVYLMYVPGKETFAEASQGFRRALAGAGTLRRRVIFHERDGAALIELLETAPSFPLGSSR